MDEYAERLKLLESIWDTDISIEECPESDLELQDEAVIIAKSRAKMEPAIPHSIASTTRMASHKSYAMGTPIPPSKSGHIDGRAAVLRAEEFSEFKLLKKGETAEDGLELAPWKLVRGYSNMFIGKTNKPLVSGSTTDLSNRTGNDLTLPTRHSRSLMIPRSGTLFGTCKLFQPPVPWLLLHL
jgi:hypothetical protein